MFLGLRTVIHSAPDLDAAKTWWSGVLGAPPYYDDGFYVGYSVGGYELGLIKAGDPASGPNVYWGVADADAAVEQLVAAGAAVVESVQNVGGDIRTALLADPSGARFGVIENPEFAVEPIESRGPGR
ncbi:VOC family protein [Humibacter antri]